MFQDVKDIKMNLMVLLNAVHLEAFDNVCATLKMLTVV
jgi:hypothetical protein